MSKKVVFVCIHNSCRSVMAEAIFNFYAEEWVAESAGVEKADKIDSTAIRMLDEAGYKVEKERPRTLDEVDLEDFDLIVTVCEESCPYIPTSKPVRHWPLEDPVGKSEENYNRVMGEIEQKVKELINEVEK
ncbi:MAG: low molecular weight phosphatase family protein [Archaeoglobaceae archaeon]